MPGMAWCYTSDPNKVRRIKEGDKRPKNDGTILPIASDPATAGCIWQMVRLALSEKYTGFSLSVTTNRPYRNYSCTMFGPEGQPVLECYGVSDGECAMRALSWVWFK